MSVLKMIDLNLTNKRVLIREDLNVPIDNGHITNDARIQASLPTIRHALQQQACIILLSHLGRPKEGKAEPEFSLAPIATHLSKVLTTPVRFEKDWINGVSAAPGEIVLCENVRFQVGEKSNDPALAKKMAALCDIYVMDAFGSAHRAHASTHGVAEFAKQACAGLLLVAELEALGKAFDQPKPTVVAIVGGAKVSSKLTVLQSLLKKVDCLIVGGGIANTFIAAQGHEIGASLMEKDLIATAQELLQMAGKQHKQIPIPTDVVCGKEFSNSTPAQIKNISEIATNDMILDIGPQSTKLLTNIISKAGTVLWNGPVGVFEFEQFARGTEEVAHAIATSSAFSIAGGGDTLAAIDKFGVQDQISYISTGGGAFLEYLEGKKLPAVEILERRAHN